jgi:outer membrane biosynthesis protein TonB
MPYRGTFNVPIVIRKDGTVKILSGAFFQSQDLKDAIESAIAKWKFKPYLIDGQPIEVQYNVGYVIDGKPFVPSYQRPKP